MKPALIVPVRCLLPAAVLSGCIASATAANHHLVFASDTQYPWTEKSDSGATESESTTKSRSYDFIMKQARATRAYREANGGLAKVPLFINGDITAFGHGWQRKVMYGAPFAAYGKNFYWILGNHDYQNNVDDCADNGCARDMVHDMRGTIEDTYRFRYFDDNKQDNGWARYTGSLAYSMQFGQLLTLHLQNEPTYTKKFESGRSTIHITSSLDFLERELRWARLAGKDVILNMHKAPFDNWTAQAGSADRTRFINLMKDNEDIILGIFAGHLHRSIGIRSMIGRIPVYLSGAPHYETFLTATYDDEARSLRVFKVAGNDWKSNSAEIGMSQTRARNAAAIPDINDYPQHGWGTWGDIDMCPDESAIISFAVKNEAPRGDGDDTGVNGVVFRCKSPSAPFWTSIESKVGPWGEWTSTTSCPGFITGLQHRIERPLGDGDDVAVSDLRFQCDDGSVRDSGIGSKWGTWGDMHTCPVGTVAAGVVTKVEDPVRGGDDTALNRVQLFCRPPPK